MRALVLSAFVVVAVACGGDVDERPATFSYIWRAILLPNCATSGCHSGLSRNSGISFQERAEAFENLSKVVDTPLLRGIYRGGDGEYLPRMPPDQPLPEADILLIERWILDGRLDN